MAATQTNTKCITFYRCLEPLLLHLVPFEMPRWFLLVPRWLLLVPRWLLRMPRCSRHMPRCPLWSLRHLPGTPAHSGPCTAMWCAVRPGTHGQHRSPRCSDPWRQSPRGMTATPPASPRSLPGSSSYSKHLLNYVHFTAFVSPTSLVEPPDLLQWSFLKRAVNLCQLGESCEAAGENKLFSFRSVVEFFF